MTNTIPASLNSFWQSFYAKNPSAVNPGLPAAAQGYYPLHDLALLIIEGSDACTFLQGQLTADVSTMDTGDAVFAAHCDAKGRMHANAVLYCQSNTRYLLQMPAANIDIATKALAKYAVFSKVELSSWVDTHAAFGARQDTKTADTKILVSDVIIDIPATGYCVHWIDLRNKKAEQLNDSINFLSNAQWQTALIDAGIAFVTPATSGEFIPQMFNLDAINGINFSKGCYTGQEIIARMKYRGQVKRRCYQFSANAAQLPADFDAAQLVGKSIDDSNHKSAATVVAATSTRKGLTGLAVIKMAVLNAGLELSLNDNAFDTGKLPVNLAAPPYPLD
jgi:hypothetical protein